MPLTITTATLAQVVKQETELPHRAVEDLLLPRLDRIQSKENYAEILRMFYGYFHPLEKIIQQQIVPQVLPDIGRRRTASLILADLAVLGYHTLPAECRTLPQITNMQQAFGALYVLEGSTLGGKIIARMLAKNSAVSIPPEALNFFTGYGEETGRMWTTFLEALNRQTDADIIVDSARQTFVHLKNWMKHTLYYE